MDTSIKTGLFQAHKQLTSELSLITKLIIYTGLILFVLSLLLTSFFTSGEDIRGYWILILGWIGLIIFQYSWFANPLNLLSLLLVNQRPKLALLLSAVAFLLASQAFIFSEIPSGTSSGKIYIKEFGLGLYVWYLAQGLFLMGMFMAVLNRRKKNED